MAAIQPRGKLAGLSSRVWALQPILRGHYVNDTDLSNVLQVGGCLLVNSAPMKHLLNLIVLAIVATAGAAESLTLTWIQPPGYQSTLYSSTNIAGAWTQWGVVNPPVVTQTTNQMAFFYVVVVPTNAASLFIYTNNPNIEGLKPSNTNAPAMAYTDDGSGPMWVWSITEQAWK